MTEAGQTVEVRQSLQSNTLAATLEKKILNTWISERLAQAAQSVVWSSLNGRYSKIPI